MHWEPLVAPRDGDNLLMVGDGDGCGRFSTVVHGCNGCHSTVNAIFQ